MRCGGWALALFVAGCQGEVRVMSAGSAASETPRVERAPIEASSAEPSGERSSVERTIAIKSDADVDCEAEAIGVVDAAGAYDDANAGRDGLRAQAAKVGADAVIDVKRVTTDGEVHVIGTAVRCRAIQESRPYDVLERIDIPAQQGATDAAFAALRARAWELHADLVLGVRLTQDDADHAHVTGVAIRYR